jgi:hypothetical protein
MNERFHTTITERGGFRSCRRRWHLQDIQNLRHKNQVPWALIFGEAIHKGLEYYYKANARKVSRALQGFTKQWKIEQSRLQDTYGPFYSMGIGDEWLTYKEKGETMLRYYDIYDRQSEFQWDEIIEVVNVETRLYVDILTPSGEQIDGLPLLSGRPDLIVRKKNGIWIVDHKTAASAYDARALDVDDQLTGLAYLWYRLSGDVPRGAIYNALIKEPPHPPKILKDGTPSKDKAQRTTYDLYVQALKDCGIRQWGDYEDILDYLEKKKWNQFFVRDGLQKNIEELESFEWRLFHEYIQMNATEKDPKAWAYPNPSQMTCPGCSVLPICQAMEEQSNVDYVIQDMYVEEAPRVEIPKKILSSNWKGV